MAPSSSFVYLYVLGLVVRISSLAFSRVLKKMGMNRADRVSDQDCDRAGMFTGCVGNNGDVHSTSAAAVEKDTARKSKL